MKPIGIFPGSFDPFTVGHLSVLERALPLFSEVYVAVGYNQSKETSTKVEERLETIRQAVNKFPNVNVISYSGLTVDEARKVNATFMIRGIRDVADFEQERRLAEVNRKISGLETIFFLALPEYAAFSSSVVRELRSYGADISSFIP